MKTTMAALLGAWLWCSPAAAQPPADDADAAPDSAAEAETEDAEEASGEGEDPRGGYTPIWAAGGEPEGGTGEPTEDAATTAPSTAPRAEGPPSSVASDDDDDADTGIPLRFELGGYYRARAVWAAHVPVVSDAASRAGAQTANFLFQRLRAEPRLLYGSDEDAPIAKLQLQIDALDNAVWGDNARLANTPIFAADPSVTDTEGFDVPSITLKRAWLEFLIPVGQIRVGRMPSQWGLGILTSGGDGLGEWGDPMYGTTYDRFLFATRPLTIANALSRGDSRPTPLIFVVAYDQLVEDPLNDPRTDLDEDPADPETRSAVPYAFLANGDDDVQEAILALVWNDPDVNPNRESDQLVGGLYYVHRWQTATDSYVHIIDAFTNSRYALGPRAPSLLVEGELVTIQGVASGISLAGGCDPERCNETDANIWGAVGRVGLMDREQRWTAKLELGYSSGDGRLFDDDELTARPLHPDYHVGLLMYQVALNASTSRLGESIRPLWSRGGVWNSSYIYPQARYTLLPGVEVHAAFLLGWADELLPTVYVNDRADFTDTSCSLFEGDCFIGWEADLALRLKWGEDDLLWWDTEAALMRSGDALYQKGVSFGLGERYLWTLQTRVAMQF